MIELNYKVVKKVATAPPLPPPPPPISTSAPSFQVYPPFNKEGGGGSNYGYYITNKIIFLNLLCNLKSVWPLVPRTFCF